MISSLLMIVAFVLIFYFLILRPQKNQERKEAEMRNNLRIGDEISTTGGILGRVVKIKDDIITIKPHKQGKTKIHVNTKKSTAVIKVEVK